MTTYDIIGLISSYVYAFGLLVVVEKIGSVFSWPQHLTRKIIHIGAGMWIWAILVLFDTWQIGIIPFATFILLNYIFYRKETFKMMDRKESTPGTVYFAISITILFVLFWRKDGPIDYLAIAVASIMAMTWGDALASIFGIQWGKKRIRLSGSDKSWIGSFTMLLVSILSIFLSLLIISKSGLSPFGFAMPQDALIKASLLTGVAATIAEMISPAGTDNLTVPLTSALVLWLMLC